MEEKYVTTLSNNKMYCSVFRNVTHDKTHYHQTFCNESLLLLAFHTCINTSSVSELYSSILLFGLIIFVLYAIPNYPPHLLQHIVTWKLLITTALFHKTVITIYKLCYWYAKWSFYTRTLEYIVEFKHCWFIEFSI